MADKAIQTRVDEKEYKRLLKIAKKDFGSMADFLHHCIKNYRSQSAVTLDLMDTIAIVEQNNGIKDVYCVTTSGMGGVLKHPVIVLTPMQAGKNTLELAIIGEVKMI